MLLYISFHSAKIHFFLIQKLLLFHQKSSISVLPIVQTFYQHLCEIISALTMKRFVVRKYKPLYQPHAFHPLIDFFVGSV